MWGVGAGQKRECCSQTSNAGGWSTVVFSETWCCHHSTRRRLPKAGSYILPAHSTSHINTIMVMNCDSHERPDFSWTTFGRSSYHSCTGQVILHVLVVCRWRVLADNLRRMSGLAANVDNCAIWQLRWKRLFFSSICFGYHTLCTSVLAIWIVTKRANGQ